MNEKFDERNIRLATMDGPLKNWLMVILTIMFVSLYASALIGWLRPLADVTMITRLEPLIFVIIGYYFGRLPAQANEQSLKEEVNCQAKKTDASQYAKETAEKGLEAMEEKIKNAKIALVGSRRGKISDSANAIIGNRNEGTAGATFSGDRQYGSVETAIEILSS